MNEGSLCVTKTYWLMSLLARRKMGCQLLQSIHSRDNFEGGQVGANCPTAANFFVLKIFVKTNCSFVQKLLIVFVFLDGMIH